MHFIRTIASVQSEIVFGVLSRPAPARLWVVILDAELGARDKRVAIKFLPPYLHGLG